MKKYRIVLIIVAGVLLVVAVIGVSRAYTKNKKELPIAADTAILKDGRQCYTYSHEATQTEPYTVNEFIDMTIRGNRVVGTKRGTQAGPDMTNGYVGTITGTTDHDTIIAVFSYSVEGSSNKEQEIYQARQDQIGIEKLRYPLIEKNGMLMPDTTKAFTKLLYARVGCTASN